MGITGFGFVSADRRDGSDRSTRRSSLSVVPVSSGFGANVFRVADGDTGGTIPGMDAHGEYFDPVRRGQNGLSDDSSLKNLGNIIVGDYGSVRAR
jgi:hypothetical protein